MIFYFFLTQSKKTKMALSLVIRIQEYISQKEITSYLNIYDFSILFSKKNNNDRKPNKYNFYPSYIGGFYK